MSYSRRKQAKEQPLCELLMQQDFSRAEEAGLHPRKRLSQIHVAHWTKIRCLRYKPSEQALEFGSNEIVSRAAWEASSYCVHMEI